MNSSRAKSDLLEKRVGVVHIEPVSAIEAGSVGQWRFVFTAGAFGIDEGGTIILSQRTACDWERPQMTHPERTGYTTVYTAADVRLETDLRPNRTSGPGRNGVLLSMSMTGLLLRGNGCYHPGGPLERISRHPLADICRDIA